LSITITLLTNGEELKISSVDGIASTSINKSVFDSFNFSIIGRVKIASPIKAVCIIKTIRR
jgi:hypothetical protein